MEATRYRRVCRLIGQASPRGRRGKQQFCDAVIVKVYFGSTHCDRPVRWARDERNWPPELLIDLIGTLPSQPTMSRRMRTVGVLELIRRLQVMTSQRLQEGVVKMIDSKPLKVGGYSKDRDARRGRAAGEMARGYKPHAICSGKSFSFWAPAGMNVNDQIGAALLLPQLSGWGYVTADNGHDANAVHQLSGSVNPQLIAPPREANAHVRDVKRNTARRISIKPSHFCACIYCRAGFQTRPWFDRRGGL